MGTARVSIRSTICGRSARARLARRRTGDLVACRISPAYAAQSLHDIEVPVAAKHRHLMLATLCSNPKIIHWYRPAGLLQLQSDLCINSSRFLVNIENPVIPQVVVEPSLVCDSVPGLRDGKAELTQRDHGNF